MKKTYIGVFFIVSIRMICCPMLKADRYILLKGFRVTNAIIMIPPPSRKNEKKRANVKLSMI